MGGLQEVRHQGRNCGGGNSVNAYISGAACRAVFVEGTRAYLVNLDRPTERLPLSDGHQLSSAVSRALADSSDIKQISVEEEKEGLEALLKEANKDSALRLFEIALDPNLDDSLAGESIDVLNSLLNDQDTYEFICNYVYAIPYGVAVEKGKISQFHRFQTAWNLIEKVIDAQDSIKRVRDAWKSCAISAFQESRDAKEAEYDLVECGAFKLIAEHLTHSNNISSVLFDLHYSAKRIVNHREIIRLWLAEAGIDTSSVKQHVSYNLASISQEEGEIAEQSAPTGRLATHSDSVRFENVQAQKAAIVERLKRGDLPMAKRFARELVADQVQAGDAEFGAKTLCSLAQEAKAIGDVSLQLEWTEQATKVFPDDPWPFGQVADILVALFRYDEAREYYDAARVKGDERYGRFGRARLELVTGHPETAHEEFKRLANEFPNHADAVYAWVGIGDALKATGKLVDALAAYDRAAERFPDREEPLLEKALVLRVLGDLDQAASVYDQVSDRFGETLRQIMGRAEIHRASGAFEAALDLYERAIRSWPTDAYLMMGRSQVLLDAARPGEAQEAFEDILTRFGKNPHAYRGLAQSLRGLDRLSEALSVYERASQEFPHEAFLRNGKAQILKWGGDLHGALRTYDQNCSDFPYNIAAYQGRVQIFKELEKLDLALAAARDMRERFPDAANVRHTLASILSLLGHYEEADELLPNTAPRTLEDWRAYHIGCMIRLRRGEVEGAIEQLNRGLNSNPFYRSRAFFQNALAAAELQRGHFEAASQAARLGIGAAAKLILIQSEATLGNVDEARSNLRELELDPHDNVVKFSRVIGNQYGLRGGDAQYDRAWIFRRNSEIVLALAA